MGLALTAIPLKYFCPGFIKIKTWLFCSCRLKSRLGQPLSSSLLFDLPLCSEFSTEKLQLPIVQKPLFKSLYIPLLIIMHLYGFLRNSVIYGNHDLIQILIPQVFSICKGAKIQLYQMEQTHKEMFTLITKEAQCSQRFSGRIFFSQSA